MSPGKVSEPKKQASKPTGHAAVPSPAKESFVLQWKSLGIGVVVGLVLFIILLARGAHPTEIDILGIKFSLPSFESKAGSIPFESTVLSITYIASGWDPHIIDMRSAAEDGIPVWPGESLAFSDIWITGPTKPENIQAQMKFYVNEARTENCIGETPVFYLLPSKTLVKQITLLKYTQDNKGWTIQEDWNSIVAVITLFSDEKEFSSNETLIRLNRTGTAWLNPYSDAKFAEITYQINGGSPEQVDFRHAPVDGWSFPAGGELCVVDIWYRSKNASKNNKLAVEATLGEFSESVYRNSPTSQFRQGVNQLQNFTPFCWEIPPEDTFLTVTMYQSGGSMMDFVFIPISVISK